MDHQRHVWRAIVGGQPPADSDGAKWRVRENDLPLFAKMLSNDLPALASTFTK